jgi:hypothetical protein
MQVGCGGIAGSSGHARLHCNESPIYVFPEMELRGLSPNFHIHVSVSDLYIPTMSLPILLHMWTDPGNFWEYLFRIFGCVFAVYRRFSSPRVRYSSPAPCRGVGGGALC